MARTSGRNAAEHLDETLDVLLVIVDVRADAQAPEPRCDMDVLRGQLLRQVGRHALRETSALLFNCEFGSLASIQ